MCRQYSNKVFLYIGTILGSLIAFVGCSAFVTSDATTVGNFWNQTNTNNFTPKIKNARIYRITPTVVDKHPMLMVYGVIANPRYGGIQFFDKSADVAPSQTVANTLTDSTNATPEELTNQGFIAQADQNGVWRWAVKLPVETNTTPLFTDNGETYYTEYASEQATHKSTETRSDKMTKINNEGKTLWSKTLNIPAPELTGANLSLADGKDPIIVNAITTPTRKVATARISGLDGSTLWTHIFSDNTTPLLENAQFAPSTPNMATNNNMIKVLMLSGAENMTGQYVVSTLSAKDGKLQQADIMLKIKNDNAIISSYSFSTDGKLVYLIVAQNDTQAVAFSTDTGESVGQTFPAPQGYKYIYVMSSTNANSGFLSFAYPQNISDTTGKVSHINSYATTQKTIFPTNTRKGYDPVVTYCAENKIVGSYSDKRYIEPQADDAITTKNDTEAPTTTFYTETIHD